MSDRMKSPSRMFLARSGVYGLVGVSILFFAKCAWGESATTNVVTGVEVAGAEGGVQPRNPFWPVNYQPVAVGDTDEKDKKGESTEQDASPVAAVESNWEQAMKKVEIKGVSSRAGNEFFAVINGEIKTVGDTVEVMMGGAVYSWEVTRIIASGSVKFRKLTVQQAK